MRVEVGVELGRGLEEYGLNRQFLPAEAILESVAEMTLPRPTLTPPPPTDAAPKPPRTWLG